MCSFFLPRVAPLKCATNQRLAKPEEPRAYQLKCCVDGASMLWP